MLLIDARRDARVDDSGEFVRLADQDRQAWNRSRIDEGQALLRVCLARNRPGPYQLQAAINAVHSDARSAAETDWPQILELYDKLLALTPSAVIALNRAVAVAEIDGAEPALRLVDGLDLPRYHLLHAVRAELLRRLGRDAEAAMAYQAAIEQCTNTREKAFLKRQYDAIASH
jgi:RNA polymerase sigma-70 factor (ECF subfamily)